MEIFIFTMPAGMSLRATVLGAVTGIFAIAGSFSTSSSSIKQDGTLLRVIGERECDLIDEIAARLDFARGVYRIDCGHNHRPELP